MVPAGELLPDSTDCGPFSTSTRSMPSIAVPWPTLTLLEPETPSVRPEVTFCPRSQKVVVPRLDCTATVLPEFFNASSIEVACRAVSSLLLITCTDCAVCCSGVSPRSAEEEVAGFSTVSSSLFPVTVIAGSVFCCC
ncbi:Uncharacterised protein [Klebsiella variicola]|nr:Uncharacterised protein [Klebsiella variicola]